MWLKSYFGITKELKPALDSNFLGYISGLNDHAPN